MYKCNRCYKEFMSPRIEHEVIGDSDKTGIVEYYYCPYCESSDIIPEYHYYCMQCDRDFYSEDDYSIQSGCPYCTCGDLKKISDED